MSHNYDDFILPIGQYIGRDRAERLMEGRAARQHRQFTDQQWALIYQTTAAVVAQHAALTPPLLDWTAAGHYRRTPMHCVHCMNIFPTHLRDEWGRASHKLCAEIAAVGEVRP